MAYPLLNDVLAEDITRDVGAGVVFKDAAARHGISRRTLHRWLERGRSAQRILSQDGEVADTELPFAEFYVGVERARAEARSRAVAVVSGIVAKAGEFADDTDVDPALRLKAATWYLERSDPAEWGRRWAPDVPTDDAEVDLEMDAELDRASELVEAARSLLAETNGES